MSVLSPRELRIQRKMVQLMRYEGAFQNCLTCGLPPRNSSRNRSCPHTVLAQFVNISELHGKIDSTYPAFGVTQVEILGVACLAQKGIGFKRFNAEEDENGWWIGLDTGSEQEHAANVERRGTKRDRQ